MGLIVMKFGGTSVADRERLLSAARIIMRAKADGHDVAAVVSAQGDHTDELIQKAKELARRPEPRELDALLSTGETASAALLAMTLCSLGCPAVSLAGRQIGFETNSVHSAARIIEIDAERIKKELKEGNVVVATGFQGINERDDITTLGRGGSDTSAVALAATLRADICRIYTDVEGVYTADPRRVDAARKLPALSFSEMLEMSSLGAQVLLGRAVELAQKYNVKLEVLSSFTDISGTEVNDLGLEGMLIKGVIRDDNAALLSVCGVPASGDAMSDIFTRLGEERVGAELISQSAERDGLRDVSFSVKSDDAEKASSLVRGLMKTYNIHSLSCDRDITRVSIVGSGLTGYPDVPGRLFSALCRAGISAKLASGGDTKLTVVVERKEAGRAVAAVHKEFIE